MKKVFVVLGIVILITLSIIIFLVSKSSDPVDAVRDFKGNNMSNIEVIDTLKSGRGIMVYSVGEANNGMNFMYSVDMVKKSLFGYKWVGGGGHINQDLPYKNDFLLSVQLLTEEKNVHPTLFGVLKEQNIKVITANYSNSETIHANIYENKNDESFYVITFNEDVANSPFFYISVKYDDGSVARHFFKDQELQSGAVFYLNKDQFD